MPYPSYSYFYLSLHLAHEADYSCGGLSQHLRKALCSGAAATTQAYSEHHRGFIELLPLNWGP